MEIKVVCAWCGRILKEGPPEPVSHGLCPGCAAGLMAGIAAGDVAVPDTDAPAPEGLPA